jgi:hypothetical protein
MRVSALVDASDEQLSFPDNHHLSLDPFGLCFTQAKSTAN